MQGKKITVIGAANVDIGGKPFRKLIPKDSNPGTVSISLGGVGRNIAHNLSLLGNPVRFLSAIGEDAHARHIIESCRELSIDTEDCYRTDELSTSTYLFIAGEDGDMELAVADMEIVSRLTPEFIGSKMALLDESPLVVVDANIPEETVHSILRQTKAPVFAETVSRTKAEKFREVLPFIHTITPNALEAEILTGKTIDITKEASVAEAADFLLEKGVRQVIITLGAKGAYYADGTVSGKVDPLPSEMINGTGAGDALIAGVATGFLRGYDLKDSLMLGMASASMTLESEATNSPKLSFSNVQKRAGLFA